MFIVVLDGVEIAKLCDELVAEDVVLSKTFRDPFSQGHKNFAFIALKGQGFAKKCKWSIFFTFVRFAWEESPGAIEEDIGSKLL